MPLLIDGEVVPDRWVRADGASVCASADAIVPLAALDAMASAEREGRLGAEVACDTAPERLEPWFDRLALIAIGFPAAGDGRGFSLARELRLRGFTGELRACGPLIADQYAFARACGLDAVEIPEELARRQPGPQWRRGQHEIARGYQVGYGGRSILELRHPAREARPAGAAGGFPDGRGAPVQAWAAHW
jgi:uncharacterized protein (DUF934 family)